MAGSIFSPALRSALLSTSLVALLGACSQDRDPGDAYAAPDGAAEASGTADPSTASRAMPDAAAQAPDTGDAAICNGEAVQALAGQEATETVVAQATADSGATSVRVLGPDDMATMDFRGDRLTITTDAGGIIRTLSCG